MSARVDHSIVMVRVHGRGNGCAWGGVVTPMLIIASETSR